MQQKATQSPENEMQKLAEIQKEIVKVENMTVSESVAHFRKLEKNATDLLQNEKNPQIIKVIQDFLTALRSDIAFLEQNKNARTKYVQHQLRSLEVDFRAKISQKSENSQKSEKANEAPKEEKNPLSLEVDEKSAKLIQDFQKKAAKEFLKEITNGSGKMDELSIRKGLEFVGNVSDVTKLEPEIKNFDWLTKNEKEKLMKQLPAVRGVLGAVFMETLFASGYVAAFNGDGKIALRSTSRDNSVIQTTKEINDAINRNPELSKTLRLGLLYADGDLLNYMKASADSKGKNIMPDQQTPEKFLQYLHTRDSKNETQSSDAIKASKNFFQGIDISEQMIAANSVPEITRALEVVTPEQRAQVQEMAENITAQVQSKPEGTRMQAFAQWMGAYGRGRQKSYDEMVAENGRIGGTMRWMGDTYVQGFSTLFSSPEAALVTTLALIVGFFTMGFKKTMLTLLGTPLAIGLAEKADDAWTEDYREDNMPAVPTASDKSVAETRLAIHTTQEQADKAQELMKNFTNTNNAEILRYINGDKTAKISEAQKAILDNAESANIIKTDIEGTRKKVYERTVDVLQQLNVPVTKQNDILQGISNFTAGELINLASMTDAEFKEDVKNREEVYNAGILAKWWHFITDNPWWTVSGVSGAGLVALYVIAKRKAKKYALSWAWAYMKSLFSKASTANTSNAQQAANANNAQNNTSNSPRNRTNRFKRNVNSANTPNNNPNNAQNNPQNTPNNNSQNPNNSNNTPQNSNNTPNNAPSNAPNQIKSKVVVNGTRYDLDKDVYQAFQEAKNLFDAGDYKTFTDPFAKLFPQKASALQNISPTKIGKNGMTVYKSSDEVLEKILKTIF